MKAHTTKVVPLKVPLIYSDYGPDIPLGIFKRGPKTQGYDLKGPRYNP